MQSTYILCTVKAVRGSQQKSWRLLFGPVPLAGFVVAVARLAHPASNHTLRRYVWKGFRARILGLFLRRQGSDREDYVGCPAGLSRVRIAGTYECSGRLAGIYPVL